MTEHQPENKPTPDEPKSLTPAPEWFQKPEQDDEDFDLELEALTQSSQRGSILRPILMIAVIFFVFNMIQDWEEDIRYFFSSDTPVDLGEITSYPAQAANDSNWSPDLPHNRYIKLDGIPTRRSQSPKYTYFKLVGADIYVEDPRDDYSDNALEREFQKKKPGEIDRTYFKGEGRLMAFSEMSGRYDGLRHYYNVRYNTRFCEQYNARQLDELARQRRETILHEWAKNYQQASPKERQEQALTARPTEQELEELMQSEPLCVNAYFLKAGVTPKSLWPNMLFVGLLSLFMLLNTVLLIRWFWRVIRA